MTPGFEVPPPGGAQLQAAITADAVAGVAPLAVDFSADVSGGTATQWNWDFGDGATASGSSVSHVYQNAGNYTVKLTVTDDRGVVVNASRPITVEPAGNLAPNADAGPDQIIQLGASEAQRTVTLNGSLSSDGDGHITTYRWSGTPDPDDIAGPVVSLGAGSYEFTLTVSDDNGNSDTDTVTITVNSPDNLSPTAVSSVSANKGAAPFATEFTGSASSDPDGAIVTYRWEFGDGQTADVADTAHTYTVPGTYTAKLTVTDDKGAIATGTVVVTVTLVAQAIQDTYDYEFLGNQGAPSGDSGGILTWNHESNHGAKGLIQLDATWMSNLPAGANYTARLWLYAVCEISGFVGACPGYPDADNPYTPGLGTTKTDVLIQGSAWTEGDALTWANITETSAPSASITQDSSAAGWVSVDVTSLIAAIKAGGTDFGFSLSQENYPVLRADNGSVMVSKFCDSESSGTGICSTGSFKPYLEITVHAP
jgi:PKD repeat protein